MNRQIQTSSPSGADVAIVQNIIAPYKSLLFHALNEISGLRFKVLYLARTEGIRDWKVDMGELRFSHELIFDGKIEDASKLRIALSLYRMLSAIDPAVVILGGYNEPAFWVGLVWAKMKTKKAIVINESHLDRKRVWLKEKVKQLFMSSCDAALVDGTKHKEYAVRLGLSSEKVFIKNGTGPIDLEWYRNNVGRYRKEKERLCSSMGLRKKNFLFVGRFSPEKNIKLLINAYQRIKANVAVDWGLILVGNGPERQDIENYLSEHKVRDVVLPGFREKGELCMFYALSDVFVLPSISEPWGLVVNEALASDLPVIVSNRCGCVPDIVRDGVNGFSFNPLDDIELSERMSLFAAGHVDAVLMGSSSREILAEYTPNRAAAIFHEAITFVRSRAKQ